MSKIGWLGLGLLLVFPLPSARAAGWRKDTVDLAAINKGLCGKVMDHTANHGKDNRMWSPSLYQRRDLYVYVPPGFQPCERYPLLIWLHGFAQDEQSFLKDVVPVLDKAIACRQLPPLIAVSPDGSFTGEPCHCVGGSFFLNCRGGDFEDFVLQDVWDFVCHNYPIRCERQAHILGGVSMGGFAAYHMAIEHREAFGVVFGICPALNLRWIGKDGNYFANFDPKNWAWRTELGRRYEVLGKFGGGLIRVYLKDMLEPVFGFGPEVMGQVSQVNPIEMVDRSNLKEGELSMYVGYGGKDEYNIDAQVESFVYLAQCRGLTVAVGHDPNGHHVMPDMMKHLPGVIAWLAPQLAPYSPPLACCPNGACAASPPPSEPAAPARTAEPARPTRLPLY
jgi:S-formylglutathione hydrolase FrmB